MKRLVLLALLVSCTDQPSDSVLDSTPKSGAEQIFHHEVLPMLAANCAGCHAQAQGGFDVAFLAGDTWREIRDTLLASAVVDIALPTHSRILTKGAHSGPHITTEQAALIIRWLEAEQTP